jgi:phosphohistidine phosphatase
LAYEGYLPALVICSPAKRTRQTWHGVALGMAEPPVNPAEATLGAARPQVAPLVQYEPRAYESTANDLLDLVRGIDQETRAVLVIGHNPSISELSGLLDPIHADPDGLRTSGIAVHHFTGEWAALGADAAPIKEWYTARG